MNIRATIGTKAFRERIAAIHAYRFSPGIDPAPYWKQMWMWDLVEMKPTKLFTTVDRVISIICDLHHYSRPEFLSSSRHDSIARSRHIGFYIARKYTTQSFEVIGKSFNRDHTVVLYGFRKIERQMKDDPALRAEVRELIERCLS